MLPARFANLNRLGWLAATSRIRKFPKRCGHLAGKEVVDVDEMVGKNQSGGRGAARPGFFYHWRTDARAVEDFESTVERAQRYIEAGADGIFPEALQSSEEFKGFAREIKAPLLRT